MKIIGWTFSIVAGCFIFLMALGAALSSGGSSGSSAVDLLERDRYPIKMCWKDQARKSLTPGEARSIAALCEGLETTFVSKHGAQP